MLSAEVALFELQIRQSTRELKEMGNMVEYFYQVVGGIEKAIGKMGSRNAV